MSTTPMRTICQHCQRPITYSATRMEWWHNDTTEAFRAAGQQPCIHAQPTPGWYQRQQ
jgi:hypothetical protein